MRKTEAKPCTECGLLPMAVIHAINQGHAYQEPPSKRREFASGVLYVALVFAVVAVAVLMAASGMAR